MANLSIVPGNPTPVIPVHIDGQPALMRLNTGDGGLIIRRQAMGALRLREDTRRRATIHGIGGDSPSIGTIIQRFEIGDTELPQSSALITDLDDKQRAGPPLAGEIGGRLMSGYDMEFDFIGERVGFWQRSGCTSVMPAWAGTWSSALLTRSAGSLVTLEITVNGQRVRALLDTGARWTVIDLEAASRVGIDAATLSRAKLVVTRGADANDVFTRRVIAREIAIGSVKTENFPVLVGAVHLPFADMMLGVDFLANHRLWISYPTQQAFLQ